MKLRALLISMTFLCATGFAQDRKIIARIVDGETQKGIKDVNVIITGTPNGTVTNALGYFELSVNSAKNKTITVSHVGFKTSEIAIPTEDRFKFTLEKEYVSLGRLDLRDYPKKLIQDQVQSEKNALSNKSIKTGDGTMVVVESGASYPGGTQQFLDQLGNALAPVIMELSEKDVLLGFIVSDSGKVSNFFFTDSTKLRTATRDFFAGMETWIPATQRGHSVPQNFVLTIAPRFSAPAVNAFYKFMGQTLRYPAQARRMGVEGVVLIEFEIDSTGKINDPKLQKDIGADCGKEVKVTLMKTPLETTVGMADKTSTRKFILPVIFGLGSASNGPYVVNIGNAILLNEIIVTAPGSLPPNR